MAPNEGISETNSSRKLCWRVPIPCNTPTSITIDDYLVFPNDTAEDTPIIFSNETDTENIFSYEKEYNEIDKTRNENLTSNENIPNLFENSEVNKYDNENDTSHHNLSYRFDALQNSSDTVSNGTSDYTVTNDYVYYGTNDHNIIASENIAKYNEVKGKNIRSKRSASIEYDDFDELNWLKGDIKYLTRSKRQHDYDHHYSGNAYGSISYNNFRDYTVATVTTPPTTEKLTTPTLEPTRLSVQELLNFTSYIPVNYTDMEEEDINITESFTLPSNKIVNNSIELSEDITVSYTSPTQLLDFECFKVVCDEGIQ